MLAETIYRIAIAGYKAPDDEEQEQKEQEKTRVNRQVCTVLYCNVL